MHSACHERRSTSTVEAVDLQVPVAAAAALVQVRPSISSTLRSVDMLLL